MNRRADRKLWRTPYRRIYYRSLSMARSVPGGPKITCRCKIAKITRCKITRRKAQEYPCLSRRCKCAYESSSIHRARCGVAKRIARLPACPTPSPPPKHPSKSLPVGPRQLSNADRCIVLAAVDQNVVILQQHLRTATATEALGDQFGLETSSTRNVVAQTARATATERYVIPDETRHAKLRTPDAGGGGFINS